MDKRNIAGEWFNQPLADRIRPQTIEDVVGQTHLLCEGKPLYELLQSDTVPNMIFYGPPGVGKTTVARIVSLRTKKALRKLNGTTASTADIKDIIAESGTFSAPNGVLLYLDEIQYFNKKQQQTLLEHIENGEITLIASTTENPYFYVYGAILSRSAVFEFKSVQAEEITKALLRAVRFIEGELASTISISDRSLSNIARFCLGDVRKALDTLDLCVRASTSKGEVVTVKDELVCSFVSQGNFKYDRDSDEHYDTISAYQKSMRGSDSDAAIHYLARLMMAGDMVSACRRLMVCVCEDVGLAYPQAIPIVKSCVDIAMQVGMPEARIPLADATLLVCNAPKSNSAYKAINEAMSDLDRQNVGLIPRHLQNVHCDGDGNENKSQTYKYPHDYKSHWVKQQYLPDSLVGKRYYVPCDNKIESAFGNYQLKLKQEDAHHEH